MEKDIELKPCPFCGRKVKIIEERGGEFTVLCARCRLLMLVDEAKSVDEVAEKWNTRVDGKEVHK